MKKVYGKGLLAWIERMERGVASGKIRVIEFPQLEDNPQYELMEAIISRAALHMHDCESKCEYSQKCRQCFVNCAVFFCSIELMLQVSPWLNDHHFFFWDKGALSPNDAKKILSERMRSSSIIVMEAMHLGLSE